MIDATENDPDAGGVKIPDNVKVRTTVRIEQHAEKHFKGVYLQD